MMSCRVFYFFVAFGLFQVTSITAQTPDDLQTVGNGADVIFVLDGSNSVSPVQWTAMKAWLQNLVTRWQIGPSNVQVGFYTYGNGVHEQWTLQQGASSAQLQREIQGLQRYGGSSDAGLGIRAAYREGFQSQNGGGRSGAAKIIVHVTGGTSANPAFLQQQIQTTKEQGVAVYRVGIGAGSIASGGDVALEVSEPTYRYALSADNYETLDTLTGTLASRIADEIPSGSGASLPNTQGCLQQADLVFMLDGSSSVGDANFQRLVNYVKTFSSQLPVSQNGVHVGVMQFSSRPNVEFGLGVYTDRASLLKGMDNIQYMGGGTNTADALNAMQTQMFSQGMGARPGVPRLAVVITDGRSTSLADTVRAADAARQQHISVVAVGVGTGVNAAELQGIADSSQDVLQVQDFDQLSSTLPSLLQRACQVRTTQAPMSATLDPTTNDPCQDKLDNCAMYNADVCTQYSQWAQENCARHCHFCSPMTPQVLPPCQNKLTTCADYDKSICSNADYNGWVTDNCALFCGMCGPLTASTGYYGQCFYKGNTYNAGESWFDGCDYQCTCENGQAGQYTCYNRCPIYKDLPTSCTLVKKTDDCCLEPVCNFNPTLQTSVTSGLGHTSQGMSVCEHHGQQYVQGESWDVGCSLKCTCEEAATGKIRCQDYCPTYGVLPSNCRLQQKPGQCCSEPVCEFSTQTGSVSGFGQTSGNGAVARPTDPPACVDKLPNCAQYTRSACEGSYRPWAADNCRAFCGLCSAGQPVPTANDTCEYMGKSYRQGQTWDISCDQSCVCEEAVYGYYRCINKCPQYLNLPAECTRTPATDGQCCDVITCPSTMTLLTSATHALTPGSGHEILHPDPQTPGQMIPLVPTSYPGATVSPNPQNLPSIEGCLYKGRLYVQGQRWDDGCDQVCECTSASQGLYTCSARCPEYPNLPSGCVLRQDPADACCRSPVCQPQVQQIPIPVYSTGTVSQGQVRPPNPGQPLTPQATSGTVVVTQHFPQSANSPPTMPTGPVPSGGIGFCEYKGQHYGQSEAWTDGCDYNCLCQDASTGYWVCTDMCLHYPPMPQYCRLVTDEDFPCCQKPFCEIPGYMNSTYGLGSTHVPIVTTRPPMVVTSTTSPRPAMCVYKSQEYAQGQEWYDGCDYKCQCYDATANLHSCSDRCPTYFGLDEDRCTLEPDPRDPACCSVPVCRPPTTASPGLTTPVPTAPEGSFEVTNTPGIGYCDYKGQHYQQGDSWTDGCQYTCYCLESSNGRYRCDERCPRFPSLPSQCRLIRDFANPCCMKPTCDFTGTGGSISGHANVPTPGPGLTSSPGSHTECVYDGVSYHQGQTWQDGCHLRCRCEDAGRGLYVCDDRCASYDNLPAACVLVTDPTDLCCRVPQCSFTPVSGDVTGQGNPTPFPTLTPGQISGQVSVPTPSPGVTPTPIGYCVYKGVSYSQGESWEDGCDYTCVCEDASVGKYLCDEKCPKFPSLPAPCRLVKEPANPCCSTPDCTFTPSSGHISGHGVTTTRSPNPGSTVSPPLGPGGSTLVPPVGSTQGPTPSTAPVCVYRGQVYAEGQTWYDGCDFVCVCEPGSQGTYRCNDRCPTYPKPEGTQCTTKPDPKDPMCCVIPECQTPEPTPIVPNGPYLLPTIAPQGVVTGGSVTPSPTPYLQPTPGPDGSTLSPAVVSTPTPKEVCIYKGQQYAQGQRWQDGCDYNCECVDAPNGQYRCIEPCPQYPALPEGCYTVRDVTDPCCLVPVCPFPPTQPPTTTRQPRPLDTEVPPTGPDGHTLAPPVISTPPQPKSCLYNGVPYKTGDTWDDGCDLRCRCEDQDLNVYRCDQRCPRYDLQPGCTMVTDPRDSCCLAPFCEPVLPPTQAPNLNPGQPATPSPNQAPVPTAVPGIIVGNSVNNPNINNPHNETVCVYDNRAYRQGETWVDGCDYTCVCTDQATGRYECTERCPPYLNVPAYCVLTADPDDTCCEKAVCANPAVSTQGPQPATTTAPRPGDTTLSPRPGANPTLIPNPYSTPAPHLKSMCTYKNAVYVQGQQWYDGCDKICVCEDGTTGFYRCTDRCRVYDSVPAGCTMVIDPNDPQCCRVPQCAPTPGPYGYPTPPPGSTLAPYVVTNVPGMVTGRAPEPTPGPDGVTPTPTNACVYKGREYARGQRWQDGCDFNCVCDNEITGEYSCSDRCSTYPLVPPQCRLTRDPSDYCCQVMTCDPSQSTPSPYLTASPRPFVTPAPSLGPTSRAPTPGPGEADTPRPIPVATTQGPDVGSTAAPRPSTSRPPVVPQALCVYNGVPYSQGATWTEGCSKTCRCDDADNNYYSCQDRCPVFNNVDATCTLTLDPKDPCCQVPVCPVLPTASPSGSPGATPGPGGPTSSPSSTPYAVPQQVPPGSITGNNPNPNPNTNPSNTHNVCLYKGQSYTDGQTWEDGCDYNCTCIDQKSGRYLCDQRCPDFSLSMSYCRLVADPRDRCCLMPLCDAPSTQTPPPGIQTLVPPQGQSTQTPVPGNTVSPPTNVRTTLRPPFVGPTQSPRAVCVMNGRTYTQGQQWYDDCRQICVCDDGATGHYTCRQRCPDYPSSDPTCLVVPDPSDPTCCTMPRCPNPDNPDVPTGIKGTITGESPYSTPVPGTTMAPQRGQTGVPSPGSTQTPRLREVCVYKGQEYSTGQRWRDGCDYDCVCEDGVTGRYQCTDRCNKYPPFLTTGCRMERDPSDACCQVPVCAPTPSPSLTPDQTPPQGQPGVTPTASPVLTPNSALCVYQGVPHRQGHTWNDGCDKVCHCEDGLTGTINCDDRCPTYPNTQAGCRMVTDPRDSCCQIPVCENPNTNEPTQVVTGVPGVIEGSSLPPQSPNPLQPRASACVYQGVEYQQGQQWEDGCSYTCVCVDGLTGNYRCTERCPRVPNVPPTCHKVQDPSDLCCQLVSCPVQTPQPSSPLPPTPYTGPPTSAPTPNHGPYTPAPATAGDPQPGQSTASPQPTPPSGMCLYKNQYYREAQVWYDGCDAICTCEDGNTGFYRCQERCAAYNNVDTSCIMVPDPKDPQCCTMPECPLIPPGGTTPSGPTIIRPTQPPAVITNYPTPGPSQPVTQAPPLGPDGQTLAPPTGTTQAPVPRTGCVYKGRTYHQDEQWEDGCDYNCVCLSDQTGQYQCSQRCARVPSVPRSCVLITDPEDACCQVPYCDFGPTPFPDGVHTPTPNPYQVPNLGSTTPQVIVPGYVTIVGGGQAFTPVPDTSFGGSTDVCVYQGVLYRQGDTWDEGCDKTCICDDAQHGLYTCRDRCPSYGQLDPACQLRPNPNDPCCLVPDCNPNFVTPVPGAVVTGSNPNVNPNTSPGFSGANVTPNPQTGFTGGNPNVSPGTGPGFTESNVNVTPAPGSGVTGSNAPFNPVQGPGISGTRAPIVVPTAGPATFTGQRPSLRPNSPTPITGYNSMCVYKGATYGQGATWEDGCQFRCECTDAARGTYRCTERCSNLYFLPAGCTFEADPNDSCCQRARCSPDAFPTPSIPGTVSPPVHQTPASASPSQASTQPTTVRVTSKPGPVFQGTRAPLGSTLASFTGKPADKCVYTDGRAFRQGETWADGCAYTCVCQDASNNDFKCDYWCPVYSDIPSFCSLVPDPQDQCCQKVACQPVQGQTLVPVPGDRQPTSSPTLSPSVTNVVPVGTHSIVSGSGLVPGQNTPGYFGGTHECVYKGTVHQAGEKWDDGCDYTCECLVQEPGVYQCTSKCPKYPPLPQYCSMVNVPGQCCPSLSCNIPNVGPYSPTPLLTPDLLPTQAPPSGSVPQTNPQLILTPDQSPLVGGHSPPGGGTVLPDLGYLSGINDRCVYQGTDGQYRVYTQGQKWRVNQCDYDCQCKDARSGFYECEPVCPDFSQGQLPSACTLQTVQGQCCPALRCTNPDGTIVDYINNPNQTYVPVFGVQQPGYNGFRPGYVPGGANGFSSFNNVCVYKGSAYNQGDTWDDGCDFTCRCTDAHSGLYSCSEICPTFTALPPVCHYFTAPNDCCPMVSCIAPPTTPPPTTLPPTTPLPTGPCVATDKLDNCHLYDKATACVGQYERWARENCPVHCGYCEDAHPTAPGPCEDVLANCGDYGSNACTGQYEPWAKANCQKTCNLCPCVDKQASCDQYGAYACVGQYEAWARDNCQKTCGYCPGQSTSSTTANLVCNVPDGETLLMKGVAGAPGDLWQLWESPNTANEGIAAAQTLDNHFPSHYKAALANSLDNCNFDRIKVAVYTNCREMASITFDARNCGRDDWFSANRVLYSSFSDLGSYSSPYFHILGDPATGHEFYVGGNARRCSGNAWFFVSTRNTCSYENGTIPGFYYATGNTRQPLQDGNFESGQVLAVLGEGGSCSTGATTTRSHGHARSCVYKNQVYGEGEWWQDGCQYNCTCQDGSRGLYRCFDLCVTYTNLPPNCPLIKNPGECCAKPNCVETRGCTYKGSVYQEGQTWTDGCDYRCTCKDADTGRYECTTRCLQFNLPSVCHMQQAPPGKCCQVPVCPSHITIQYPEGYVPE